MTDAVAKTGALDAARAWPLIRRLVSEYGRVYWPRYAIAFACMAVAALVTALTAYLIGEVVNEAYLNRDFSAIVVLCFVIFLLFTLKGLSSYGQAVILARIANRITADNQRRLFDKLLHADMAFFANRHSSEFIARLSAGATSISQVLNLLITSVGRDLLSLIGLVTVMIIQDPVMSLVGLVVAPPAMFFLRKLIRRARTVAYTQFKSGSLVMETLLEMLQGIRTVKAFTLEGEMRTRVETNIAATEAASNKMARISNRSSPLMETLGGFAIALAILYGGYRVIEVGAAPGQFFSFMTAFLLAYEPGKRLARLNIDLNSAIIGVQVLLEVIDGPPGEASGPDDTAFNPAAGKIVFSDVSFSYRSGEPVLSNINFTAQPGCVTALVGASGGGKSTVLALLLRLYDPDSGVITIDDVNIASVSKQSLRRQMAYVGQDVFLFQGSVRENILFGRLGSDDAQIIAAAKAAFAHDFIMGFPQGYDTPVGEHGMQLSGGQRQRISVARALIKNAPIILLDEPTASLDSRSERLVQDAIARLCENRTTIVVAHRLHTIAHADRIHVIDEGALTESGRHEELLRRNGRYAALFRAQMNKDTDATVSPAIAPGP